MSLPQVTRGPTLAPPPPPLPSPSSSLRRQAKPAWLRLRRGVSSHLRVFSGSEASSVWGRDPYLVANGGVAARHARARVCVDMVTIHWRRGSVGGSGCGHFSWPLRRALFPSGAACDIGQHWVGLARAAWSAFGVVSGLQFFSAQVGLLWWSTTSISEHVQKADLSMPIRASALCSPDLVFGHAWCRSELSSLSRLCCWRIGVDGHGQGGVPPLRPAFIGTGSFIVLSWNFFYAQHTSSHVSSHNLAFLGVRLLYLY